jgi:hypothetical protein
MKISCNRKKSRDDVITKLLDKDCTPKKFSLPFCTKLFGFILLATLWPFLKFICWNQKHYSIFVYAASFIFVWISVFFHVYPYSLIAYIGSTYASLIICEFEGICSRANADSDPMFFIRECINANWGSTREKRDSNEYQKGNIILCSIIMVLIVTCMLLGMFVSQKDETLYIGIASVILLSTIVTVRCLEIVYYYLNDVLDTQEELQIEVEKYSDDVEQNRARELVKRIINDQLACKANQSISGVMEFCNNVNLVYILVLFTMTNYLTVPYISAYLGSGNSIVCQGIGYNLILLILLTLGIMCYVAKLVVWFIINSHHIKIIESFERIKRGLNYMVYMPCIFEFKVNDIQRMATMANTVEQRIKMEINEPFTQDIMAGASDVKIKESQIVLQEYLRFYQLIEFKCLGFVPMTKANLWKIVLGLSMGWLLFVMTYVHPTL